MVFALLVPHCWLHLETQLFPQEPPTESFFLFSGHTLKSYVAACCLDISPGSLLCVCRFCWVCSLHLERSQSAPEGGKQRLPREGNRCEVGGAGEVLASANFPFTSGLRGRARTLGDVAQILLVAWLIRVSPRPGLDLKHESSSPGFNSDGGCMKPQLAGRAGMASCLSCYLWCLKRHFQTRCHCPETCH